MQDHHKNRRDNRAENNYKLLVNKRNLLPSSWTRGQIRTVDTLGTRLRQARISKGLTISALAEASDLNETSVGRIERNDQADIRTIRRLADILGVSVTYLGGFDSLPEDTLAQKIKKARLCRGLTKREFAKVLGVNEKTVRGWERGISVPSEKKMAVLRPYLKNISKGESKNNS